MAETARAALLMANPSCKSLLVAAPLSRLSMASCSHPGLLSRVGCSSGSVLSLKAAAERKGPRCCVVRNADNAKKAVSSANYVVPLESIPMSSCLTRPLAEILRDLNKRVPDKALKTETDDGVARKSIPWYHANRMLSFYAPGWCGEVRNILYSVDGKRVTVVYRVIVRGSDGEAYRESCATASMNATQFGDPVQEAEAVAFQRACARFGLGLYLLDEDATQQG